METRAQLQKKSADDFSFQSSAEKKEFARNIHIIQLHLLYLIKIKCWLCWQIVFVSVLLLNEAAVKHRFNSWHFWVEKNKLHLVNLIPIIDIMTQSHTDWASLVGLEKVTAIPIDLLSHFIWFRRFDRPNESTVACICCCSSPNTIDQHYLTWQIWN